MEAPRRTLPPGPVPTIIQTTCCGGLLPDVVQVFYPELEEVCEVGKVLAEAQAQAAAEVTALQRGSRGEAIDDDKIRQSKTKLNKVADEGRNRPKKRRPQSAAAIYSKGPSAYEVIVTKAGKDQDLSPERLKARILAVRKRPQSAPQVNLNKVAGTIAAPSWTMRGKPNTQVCIGGGIASRRAAALTPGPGQYKTVKPEDYWCKRGPAHTLAPSRGVESIPMIPGPSDYRAAEAEERAASFKRFGGVIGNEERLKAEVRGGPGPIYEVRKTPGDGCQARTFGEARALCDDPVPTPGPADYNPYKKALLVGRGAAAWRPDSAYHGEVGRGDAAFGTRTSSKMPGPGRYEVQFATLKRRPAYHFSKEGADIMKTCHMKEFAARQQQPLQENSRQSLPR